MDSAPQDLIKLALDLARGAPATASPNPRVGCVITDSAGRVLGQGHTQRAGGPHAEIMALSDAAALGHSVHGATAWVTLEPCSHQGRTGPCCDALAAAGIAKVVASLTDPNPLVAGQGFQRLRAAGVEVEIGPGAAESRELNLGFFSRMIRKTPWVRMKIAASLDGKTALENGASQWITSEPARADGHAWRARADAILTGIGTVLEDDPQLDVRLVQSPRQPHLVVVDSRLETPLAARLFQPARQLLIYFAVPDAARQAWPSARAGSDVIHWLAPFSSAVLPSSEAAIFSRTHGVLRIMRLKKPRLSSRDSAAPAPISTSMPAARRRSKPWPATSGLGSGSDATTRPMPAATSASQQGPVRP
jgi:diaminohydroxyphosphoribosylaminopyrimidine deaminase/5-amino-6-(5-phosphoribosylamino)uracil reductase